MSDNEKKIIGYIDILGTKEKLQSRDSHQYMEVMNHTYKAVTDTLNNIAEGQNISEIQYKIFSDNMVFVMDFSTENLNNFIKILSMFQYALVTAKEPFYVRGAICLGNILINKLCVTGPGLLTAYKLENEAAINPRIIIDPALIKKDFIQKEIFDNFLCTLDDEYYFLNYLEWSSGVENSDRSLTIHHLNIEKEYIVNKNKPRVLSKYEWLRHYFHYFCLLHDINICANNSTKLFYTEKFVLKDSIPYSETDNVKIPVYGLIAAGSGMIADNNIIDYETAETSELTYPYEEYFYLKVRGDSMYPVFLENDYVLVHRQDVVDSGSYACVIVDEEEGAVKRVVYTDEWIELQSLNPNHPTRRFERAEKNRVKFFGLVKSLKRNF